MSVAAVKCFCRRTTQCLPRRGTKVGSSFRSKPRQKGEPSFVIRRSRARWRTDKTDRWMFHPRYLYYYTTTTTTTTTTVNASYLDDLKIARDKKFLVQKCRRRGSDDWTCRLSRARSFCGQGANLLLNLLLARATRQERLISGI